ncbi:hypothetical protein STEG23_027576 [Scotinomys teguina]
MQHARSSFQSSTFTNTHTASGQNPTATPGELSTPAPVGPIPLTRPDRGGWAWLDPKGTRGSSTWLRARLRVRLGPHGGRAPVPAQAAALRLSATGALAQQLRAAWPSSRARRRAQPELRGRQRRQPRPAAREAQPRHREWPHGRAATSPGVSRQLAQPDSSGRGGDGNTNNAGLEAVPGTPVFAAAISSQRPRRLRRLRAAVAAAEEARVLGPAAAILFPV